MYKIRFFLFGLVTGLVLVVGILWIGNVRNAYAELDQQAIESTPYPLSDNGDSSSPELVSSGDNEDSALNLPSDLQEPKAFSTPIPGETLVFFAPSDTNGSATVVFLYNTDVVDHTIALNGYTNSGLLVISQNIVLSAMHFIRIVSDPVAADAPPSWVSPASIVVNFTDSTSLASLSLPKGVKMDGYILFNPDTKVVNPQSDQGAVPLRFSTDPATIFLPSVINSP